MADLIFVGQFVASKAGKTGLTVTVDVDRYTMADGTRTALVTAGSATEGRRGLYHYRLASADLALYQYVATFITADTSVDQQEVAALGLVVPDALVSSRLEPATAGRKLLVSAMGEVDANLTDESVAILLSGLNGATATVVSSVLGGTMTVYVADTWRFTVASDQLDLADYETLGLGQPGAAVCALGHGAGQDRRGGAGERREWHADGWGLFVYGRCPRG